MLPRLEGNLRGPVVAKIVAFCVWDAAAYLMLFAGSVAAWEARGAAAGAADDTDEEPEAETAVEPEPEAADADAVDVKA